MAHSDLRAGRVIVCRNVWKGHEGTTKGGRSRTIKLTTLAKRLLECRVRTSSERIFVADSGVDYTNGAWRHGLYRCCRHAGMDRIGWHALRHTFASHLVMKGAPLKAVQELLGHATIEMTMRYSHLSPATRDNAIDLLNETGSQRAESAQEETREDKTFEPVGS